VRIRLGEGTKVEAQIRDHIVVTDQIEKAGGENTAPNPFELFLASIGTCAGFYLQAFCRKHKIPTDDIELEMALDRNEETKLIETITIRVSFPLNFPRKYVPACIKSAEQCTVKKHLQDPPTVLLEAAAG